MKLTKFVLVPLIMFLLVPLYFYLNKQEYQQIAWQEISVIEAQEYAKNCKVADTAETNDGYTYITLRDGSRKKLKNYKGVSQVGVFKQALNSAQNCGPIKFSIE